MADPIHADVAVVGLGAMGAAALAELARRGVKAVGIDRFAPPHDLGSSHGETRITRQAVGEGAALAPFVMKSHEIWRALEEETGESLLVECGALIMGKGANSHHGKPDFVRATAATAKAFSIPHEMLAADEIRRRFPQFLVDDDTVGCFEPGGGYVRPERCIAAALTIAQRHGATMRTGETVTSITQIGDGVEVVTSSGIVRASRAIVSAGAWIGPLLGSPFDRLLSVKRQVLHWFEMEPDAAFSERSPVFVWMHGTGDTDYLYGFPPLPGDSRVKVATEQYEAETTADSVERTVRPEESAAMFRTHVEGRLAGVSPRAVKAAACVYTVTPDFAFIIDDHPAADRILVVSACSGHGFKHSAGIGHAVAARVTTGASPIDFSPFSLARLG
ncbi:N-methyl-L-tryptophan oxidase [Hansschlegelia quercus]|uniref:N-methyl-L-tryptophan oxidase n=1 Tax=Hansschlegelia quercus TaxID=2528245 RepID=A0A4Q9GGT4_9HYPH|nr:N-methyl-L-tryptophan oxidase [Hansschlegelia quercus]TBN52571.1 N-methyl-L-tryptophan oxidase [Hansschlegelia quercus]